MIESLYLLLPLSVLFVIGIGVAFWWAIFSGQFDDMQRAADAVLADDDNPQTLSEGQLDPAQPDTDSTAVKAAGRPSQGRVSERC